MDKKAMQGRFKRAAMTPEHPAWSAALGRLEPIYTRNNDIRSDFGRDYTRILHSMAYRRLKHKTQVYFSPEHDHISTRIDHVHYVISISRLIADYLGLNGELTEAIALGHDLGHTPFGHVGERIIGEIAPGFWHGRNGLHIVDDIELLTGPDGRQHNLNLTYAVRDGIISHSGGIGNRPLRPRKEAMDLSDFNRPGQFSPFTWEACVVKIADNIAYLGRDIDDAAILGLIDDKAKAQLASIVYHYAKTIGDGDVIYVNNANVINLLITDLCRHSTPDRGIGFSPEGTAVADAVLDFNNRYIYSHPRLTAYADYGQLVIHRIFEVLKDLCSDYDHQRNTFERHYPLLTREFTGWIEKYWDRPRDPRLANHVIYRTRIDSHGWTKAIIDYITAMTDRYIQRVYREQITF